MQLLIRQRVFSWTDTYDIYDADGNAKYFVKAEFFALGHQIHVYDRTGQEVGSIHQKCFCFLPTFEIWVNGQYSGRIRKAFTFFRPQYNLEYGGWQATGNFLGWEYDVIGPLGEVMHISKEIFHWGDTYVLHIVNPSDEIHCLLLAIAIDAANCSN
jgi:uncharacterized protein YxjI